MLGMDACAWLPHARRRIICVAAIEGGSNGDRASGKPGMVLEWPWTPVEGRNNIVIVVSDSVTCPASSANHRSAGRTGLVPRSTMAVTARPTKATSDVSNPQRTLPWRMSPQQTTWHVKAAQSSHRRRCLLISAILSCPVRSLCPFGPSGPSGPSCPSVSSLSPTFPTAAAVAAVIDKLSRPPPSSPARPSPAPPSPTQPPLPRLPPVLSSMSATMSRSLLCGAAGDRDHARNVCSAVLLLWWFRISIRACIITRVKICIWITKEN